MIDTILVTNASDESLPLTLMRPETSGFIVRNIDGLGPAKATVNLRENSGMSGSIFNSARTPSRNIVLLLEFLESPTIEAARLRAYKYFPVETRIRLDITTEAGTFYIYGYVESNEPVIFSEKQTCSISILCPDPYFRKDDGFVSGVIHEWANLLEFPFENEVGATNIIFGEEFFQTIDFVVPFAGTVVVEPTIILYADGGAVSNPRIFFYNENDPNVVETMGFTFSQNLPALADGDYLRIVCERLNKSVTRFVSAEADPDLQFLNYLGAVDIDSTWPTLRPGNNQFSYEADSGGAYIRFAYEYELKFIGV